MKATVINQMAQNKNILLTKQKCNFSLIWLHGLGDSSTGFFDYFQHKASPLYKGARILLLDAPLRKVTINGGMHAQSWYDIKSLSFTGRDQTTYSVPQIKESLTLIDNYVSEQIAFWKLQCKQESEEKICKRIVIGGFSQGCAISFLYALTSKRILGGLVGFSGHAFTSFPIINKDKVPILIYHGTEDSVINYQTAKKGYEMMLPQGAFEFRTVQNLEHTVTIQQLTESTSWILKKLNL